MDQEKLVNNNQNLLNQYSEIEKRDLELFLLRVSSALRLEWNEKKIGASHRTQTFLNDVVVVALRTGPDSDPVVWPLVADGSRDNVTTKCSDVKVVQPYKPLSGSSPPLAGWRVAVILYNII